MATIVIAEDEFWQPGVDFGAAMGRRGYRVVRATASSAQDRIQKRWAACADEDLADSVMQSGAVASEVLEVLESPDLVDWQAAEPIESWLCRSGFEERLLPYTRTTGLAPDAVIDKASLAVFLRHHGVGVPPQWTRPDDIPDQESGPFLVKPLMGGGGVGVRVVPDAAGARAALATSTEPLKVQPFLPGEPLDSAGVARAGEVVQMLTYRNRINPATPFSAAFGITVTRDSKLEAVTRRVVDLLGITGPFALDAVADAEGNPLVVDVNIRIWGCWTACHALGMDVLGSYEYALGRGGHPGSFSAPAGAYAEIMRRPPLEVATIAERARWLVQQASLIGRRRRWLGATWARATARDSLGWALRGQILDTG